MTQRALNLPDRVALRTAPALPSGEVHAAIGASRQRVYLWRQHRGFPASAGGMLDTARVAAWLTRRGCKVIWT